ncbi:MAG: hypothetical protein ACJ77K_05610 [Bacteroidia bacterium]
MYFQPENSIRILSAALPGKTPASSALKSFIFCILISFSCNAQSDTIKVHFLYGSKPLRKYKKTELTYFGGLHGGHVTIEVDSIDYGFSPADRVHIFSHGKSKHSQFTGAYTHHQPPYPEGNKLVTFYIPITAEQYQQIKKIEADYCANVPYDYAFFGMRCSASAEDILGQIGILKRKKRNLKIVRTNFYPKKLRKRMFRLAREKNYRVVMQEGRKSRKWESD